MEQQQTAVQDLTVTTPDGTTIESDFNAYVMIVLLLLVLAVLYGIKKFVDSMFGGN